MRRATLFLLVATLIGPKIACGRSGADDLRYELVTDWPSLPRGVEFGDVSGVAVDSHDHVFVLHRGSRTPILAFEGGSGRLAHAFEEDRFSRPHGLAVDANDHVWVADAGSHQVFEFTHDGVLLRTFGEAGVAGDDEGRFDGPTDVAVARDGSIYVSDGYGNGRMVKLAPDGRFLLAWGTKGDGPGQFDVPHGIAVDPEGNVYVADRGNRRIQVFDADGRFHSAWGEGSLGAGGRPWGLAYAGGRLFVVDGGDGDEAPPNQAALSVLDPSGAPQARWSAYGRGPGELLWGHDVAVGRDGSVYVVEVRDGDRVQKFRAR